MKNVMLAAVAALTFGSANVWASLCGDNKADHETQKQYKIVNDVQGKLRDWYAWTKGDENQGLVKRAAVRIVAGTPLIVGDGVVGEAAIAADEVQRVAETVLGAVEEARTKGNLPEKIAFLTVDPVSNTAHFTIVNIKRGVVTALEVIDATTANLFDASSELFVDISDALANTGEKLGGKTGRQIGNVVGAPFVVAAFILKGAEWAVNYIVIDYGVNLVVTTFDSVGDVVCDIGDGLGYLVRLDPDHFVGAVGDTLEDTATGIWSIFKAVIKPATDLFDLIGDGSEQGRQCLKHKSDSAPYCHGNRNRGPHGS